MTGHGYVKALFGDKKLSCEICEKEPDIEFDNAPFFCTGCGQSLVIESGIAHCTKCHYHHEFRLNGAVAVINVIYSEESSNQSKEVDC